MKNFLNTPLPLTFLKPFQALLRLLRGDKQTKQPSDAEIRKYLLILGILSLPIIWIMEGLGNPLELLVDIPLYTFSIYPAPYNDFYMVLVVFFTMLAMYGVQYGICKGNEYSIFSINGLYLWLIGTAVGLLVDTFTRNILMDKILLPWGIYANGQNDPVALGALGLVLSFMLFYAFNDAMSTTLAVMATPLVMGLYRMLTPASALWQNVLVSQLIVTFALKLLLMVFEKIGLIGWIVEVLSKYCYTPRYIPMFFVYIMLIPLWPILLIWKLARRKKTKETTE